jgi:predicted nucleic acid-binding Zn finger protein
MYLFRYTSFFVSVFWAGTTRSARHALGLDLGVKTGGYGRIVVHPVSYPNVFKTDSGSDTDS